MNGSAEAGPSRSPPAPASLPMAPTGSRGSQPGTTTSVPAATTAGPTDSPFLHPSIINRASAATANGTVKHVKIGKTEVGGGPTPFKAGGGLGGGEAAGSDKMAVDVADEATVQPQSDRKGKGKAKVEWTPEQVDELDAQELGRPWGPHLVPLNVVIQRTVAQVFGELQLVAETAPAASDFERKKRLIDYVIHSRRQIIKLLVLVKWSASSATAHKLMSIVEFLARQNQQFQDTVDMLHRAKAQFYTARLRNYDLPQALQVLTHGKPLLPGILVDSFGHRPDLTPKEVLEALEELEDLMRYRLAMREVLPDEFKQYAIGDGKVKFRVEGLFEATFTLSGQEDDAIWFLLDVNFLFSVSNARGIEYSSKPTGDMKQRILMLGNQELAGGPPTEQQPEPKPPEQPLMKAFAFLRTLALNYQLEALFSQAAQLDRTAWAGNVRVTVPNDRRSLSIDYWTRARPPVQPRGSRRPPSAAPPALAPQGTLTISIESSKPLATTARVLAVLSGAPASDTQRMNVAWDRKGIRQSEANTHTLQFRPGKLDLESLLEGVVDVETDLTLRQAVQILRAPVSVMPGFPNAYLVEQDRAKDEVPNPPKRAKLVRTQMHADRLVEVGMDRHSGRYTIRLIGETSAQAQSVIKRATETLNEVPDGMREMLVRVRSTILMDDLEIQASHLGLQYTRRLLIDPARILGTGPIIACRVPIFVTLPGAPSHYLLVMINEKAVQCSLIVLSEAPADQAKPLLNVVQHIRLPIPEVGGETAKQDAFTLTRQQLLRIYQDCLARVTLNSLARQVAARRIPLKLVGPPARPTSVGGSTQAEPIPSICIPSKAVFSPEFASVASPVVRIRLQGDALPSSSLQASFELRVRDVASPAVDRLDLSDVVLDRSSGLLRWSTIADASALQRFLEWTADSQRRLVGRDEAADKSTT